jgi:hypothetical protein
MRYLLSIYGDESQMASAPEGAVREMSDAYATFTAELREAGAMLGGDALQPTSSATTVRVRDGERLLTDGPFAETREQLGGFYLIECADLDEALAWAARIPGAAYGSIEVRPVMVFAGEDAGDSARDAAATA